MLSSKLLIHVPPFHKCCYCYTQFNDKIFLSMYLICIHMYACVCVYVCPCSITRDWYWVSYYLPNIFQHIFWNRVSHCTWDLLFWPDQVIIMSLESVSLFLHCSSGVTRVHLCLDFLWVLRFEFRASCLYNKSFTHWVFSKVIKDCFLEWYFFWHENLIFRRQEVSLAHCNWRWFDIWIPVVSKELELKFPLWSLLA